MTPITDCALPTCVSVGTLLDDEKPSWNTTALSPLKNYGNNLSAFWQKSYCCQHFIG